jgi:tetratricopeptide (TPR) repeat protein
MMSTGNPSLRVLLNDAGLSNAALGRDVVRLGAKEGVHLGTTPTSVQRMLTGTQPRWPVPRLVAQALSHRLGREVTVSECGFVDQSPIERDPYDGLQSADSMHETVRSVVSLSDRDMNRRNFLLGTAFSAAAFAEPALFAMTVPPAQITEQAAGRRIGHSDVEILQEHFDHLWRLDHRYGSGRVREQGVRLLNSEAMNLLKGSYSAKVGSALLRVVAQTSWLAGSMSADVGRHALAQRYYIQTLNLALSAGDTQYAANILGYMSRMTIHIGHSATSESERISNGRHAVALARAAQSLASDRLTPVLSGLLCAIEARGHALLGDSRETRMTVHKAEKAFERSVPENEPSWLAFYTEAELLADLGRCLRDTGESTNAERLINHALESYEPWRARSRCFVQTDLATTHLVARDYDRATSLGLDAVRTAARISSSRAVDRIRTLHRQVQPIRMESTHLATLDDEITTYLAHQPPGNEDTRV